MEGSPGPGTWRSSFRLFHYHSGTSVTGAGSPEYHSTDLSYLILMNEDIVVMTGKDPGEDTNGTLSCSPGPAHKSIDWLIPASFGLTLVVAVNAWIVYYLLAVLPDECGRIAAGSRGAVTCSTGWGTYAISGVCIALIITAIYAFVRWNLTRCRSRGQ